MTVSRNPLEQSARLIVAAVRWLARRRLSVSVVGLVLTLLAATAFILVDSLGINPARSAYTVRVMLPETGGLLPNQDVTLRGVPIGRVESVNFTDTGVVATAAIDSDVPVPLDSSVRVSALSAAGEQYLEFRPQSDHGPNLTNGSVIGQNQTSIPVSLPRLLANGDGVLAQLDAKKLAAMSDELRVGHQGPQKLAALLDGGAFLVSTLDSVLPQTVSVLRTSRTVLTTLADVTPGLRDTSQQLQDVLHGVNAMDGGFRTLVDRGSAPLTALDAVIADNSETMVQLLGKLTTTAQVLNDRVPALHHMLNAPRSSAFDALGSIMHDGAVWAIADIYPRYSCDYNLPRRPVAVPDYFEPYLYTYCANPDPSILVRGARNAPRPPGDDTAGPPPGYDPLATATPTPIYPNTIPMPYGGPPPGYRTPVS
ncbi:MAG: MlaD family protein [Mycobacterium sp.]